MGLFKLKKNKRFNYEPRFYKGSANPFEIKHKFDEYRVTIEKTNLKTTLKTALNDLKKKDQKSTNIIFVIAVVLSFIFLWIIDFDLTIFLINV